MVSCLMGDSTALASAIVRCCLKFAAMNLKKLAIWLWREKLFPFISILLCTLYDRNPAYS